MQHCGGRPGSENQGTASFCQRQHQAHCTARLPAPANYSEHIFNVKNLILE